MKKTIMILLISIFLILFSTNVFSITTTLAGSTANLSLYCGNKTGNGAAMPYPVGTFNTSATGYGDIGTDNGVIMKVNNNGGAACDGGTNFATAQFNWTLFGINAAEVNAVNFTYVHGAAWDYGMVVSWCFYNISISDWSDCQRRATQSGGDETNGYPSSKNISGGTAQNLVVNNGNDGYLIINMNSSLGNTHGIQIDMVSLTIEWTDITVVDNGTNNVTLKVPNNATWNSTRNINFTFNASASANILSCEIWTNETSWGTKTGNQTRITNNATNWINNSFNSDGNYLWNVLCNISDGNLNFSKSNFTVRVDAATPASVFVAPTESNNTKVLVNTTTINVSVTENNVDTFLFNWNGTNISTQGLVLNMHFNNDTQDYSGYENHGTNFGVNCSALVGGKFGRGCQFAGGERSINVSDDDTLDFDSTQSFTISIWLNTVNTTRMIIFYKTNAGGFNPVISLRLFDTTIVGNVSFLLATTTYDVGANSSRNLSDGKWHHVAGVVDRTSSISILYIDSVPSSLINISDLGTLKSTGRLVIGNDPVSLKLPFIGFLDEMKIYRRALSSAEINASYLAEFGKYNNTNTWFMNQSMLVDGVYTYYSWVNDSAGNVNQTGTRYVTIETFVDNGTNNITLIRPLNQTTNNTLTIDYRFNASSGSTILSCELWNNETSWGTKQGNTTRINNNQTTNISYTFASDGHYLWNVLCNTSNGNLNFSVKNYTLFVDSVIPVINFINATGYYNSNWTKTNSVTFYINATENNTDSCDIYANVTGSWTKNNTFTYSSDALSTSATQIFPDGSYAWNATCNDSASNRDNTYGTSMIINIDTVAPVINSYNQTGYFTTGNWSSTNSITFYANITDNSPANCIIYTNVTIGTNVSLTTNTTNITFTYLSNALSASPTQIFRDGSYLWNITCNDSAGNTISNIKNVTLNIDATTPTINLSRPANNSWTTSNTDIALNFTFIDKNLDTCELYTNMTGSFAKNTTAVRTTLSSGSTAGFLINLTDKSYLWNVKCNDSAGTAAINATNFTINVDTVAPVINWYNATGYKRGYDLHNWSTSNSITFYVNVTDASVDTCDIYTNASGSWAKNTTIGYSSDLMSSSAVQIFADGSYKWNVSCNDSAATKTAGNAIILNVDTAAPVINFINTTGYNTFGNWSSTNTITFYVNVTDNNYDNGTCVVYTNVSGSQVGPQNQTNYTNASFAYISNALSASSAQQFADGSYLWNITCNDSAGNHDGSYTALVLNVDTAAPTIALNSPLNNTFNQSNTVKFLFSVNERNVDSCRLFTNMTGVFAANYTAVGVELAAQGSNFSILDVHDGSYLWNVKCNDSAGTAAINATNFTINIDTALPLVSINSPRNNSFNSSNTVRFQFNFTELNLDSCNLFTNMTGSWVLNYTANASQLSADGYNFSIVNVHDGSYLVNVSCNDSAGNKNLNASYYGVNIDTITSEINFSSPTDANGTYSNRNWTLVNITITEVNVDTYRIFFDGINYTTPTVTLINNGDGTQSFYNNFTNLGSGNHSFYGWVNDSAGNSNVTSNQTILLNQPPVITINFPPSLYALNRNITFNYSITDADGDTLNCSLMFNSTPQSTNASVKQGLSYNITSAVDNNVNGDFLATINCTDRINSTNSSSLTVRIDTVNPIITTTYPTQSNNKTGNSSNFTFDVSADDNNLLQFEINVTNSSRTQDIYYKLFDQINTTSQSSNAKINFTYEDRYDILLASADDHTKPVVGYNISKDLADLKLTFATTEQVRGKNNNIGIKLKSADLNLTDFGAVKNPTNDSYSFFFKFDSVENGSVRKFTFKLSANETIVYRANSSFQSHFVTGLNFVVFQLANGVNSVQQITFNPQGKNEVEISIWTTKTLLNFTE